MTVTGVDMDQDGFPDILQLLQGQLRSSVAVRCASAGSNEFLTVLLNTMAATGADSKRALSRGTRATPDGALHRCLRQDWECG